ncbi:MAG: 3-isopropylmalate dehydratase small subunit [Pseudomonadota bacterium]
MSGWRQHQGQAVALPAANIDTDQLIPARFMATPRGAGYGQYLLYDARFDEAGATRPHALNDSQPSLLIAGRNFGSGSSREAAVYALADYGIRAVFAPSFGDIFAANAVNNGLLPGVLAEEDHAALLDMLEEGPRELTVDLDQLTLRVGNQMLPISLDPVWRTKLINGWDDIDLTRQHEAAIATYATRRQADAPWAWPAR